MARITVFTPTEVEFNAARSVLTDWRRTGETSGEGRCRTNHIDVVLTGMGPMNARTVAREKLTESPSAAVLVVGLAGGLRRDLRVGDVLVYTDCVSEMNPIHVSCAESLVSEIEIACRRHSLRTVAGIGLTVSRMMHLAIEKQRRHQETGAVAVDMESHAILDVATELERNAAVLRVVSDDARHDVPDFSRAMGANYEIDNLKMLAALARNPWLGVRFLYNLNRSLRHLRRALRIALTADMGFNEGSNPGITT